MKVFIITDLEGVAGVLNAPDWIYRTSRYYEDARAFLTGEVNAAIDGFFAAGADEALVCDGHGEGGINIRLLDPRADYQRGWGNKPYPFGLDKSFDCMAFVGQHPMSRTVGGHICHTGNFDVFEMRINDRPVGEFGQVAWCGLELGCVTIFGAGDEAFAREAQTLLPGIETAAVKRGIQTEAGDDCTAEEYENFNSGAVHMSPARADAKIREGARAALERFRRSPETFSREFPRPPYTLISEYRAGKGYAERRTTISHNDHSIIDLLNG